MKKLICCAAVVAGSMFAMAEEALKVEAPAAAEGAPALVGDGVADDTAAIQA